jgi:hypothetical protein
VLLIALTNVVMLLMAQNAARQREFSVRQALDAKRSDLLRQLLAESVILVTMGGALAWGFAEMATRLLGDGRRSSPASRRDRTVMLFTLGVLVFAAVLFGLAPLRVAVSGGAELALKTSAATSNADAGKSHAGRMIVTVQMALCVVLLVWRRTANSHITQPGKHSPRNARRWPRRLRSETQYTVGSRRVSPFTFT